MLIAIRLFFQVWGDVSLAVHPNSQVLVVLLEFYVADVVSLNLVLIFSLENSRFLGMDCRLNLRPTLKRFSTTVLIALGLVNDHKVVSVDLCTNSRCLE